MYFFPNRSLLLRVLIEVQRVGTQKHTQTEKHPGWQLDPESQGPSPKNIKNNIKPMICYMILKCFYSMALMKLTLLYAEFGKQYKTNGFLACLPWL